MTFQYKVRMQFLDKRLEPGLPSSWGVISLLDNKILLLAVCAYFLSLGLHASYIPFFTVAKFHHKG